MRTALVTSSNNKKMAHVLMAHPEFTELFERVITADKITRSKPDPECYLLAARELQMEVDVCCDLRRLFFRDRGPDDVRE